MHATNYSDTVYLWNGAFEILSGTISEDKWKRKKQEEKDTEHRSRCWRIRRVVVCVLVRSLIASSEKQSMSNNLKALATECWKARNSHRLMWLHQRRMKVKDRRGSASQHHTVAVSGELMAIPANRQSAAMWNVLICMTRGEVDR